MLDERLYSVETPEQIDLQYDLAGIGSRFLAALIDHALIAIILSLLCSASTVVADRADLGLSPTVVATIFVTGIFLFLCAYYIFFETTWNGQTPGKRLIGIRMVRTGGEPIGFLGSAIRNFVRLADFLPVLYGVGALSMFIDRRSRRLGDLAAGALAIRAGKQLTLDMLAQPQAVAAQAPVVAAADEIKLPNLVALRPEDYQIVERFLRRRTELGPETRKRLAGLLLDGVQQRLGYPLGGDPEVVLLRVAAEYQLLQTTQQATPAQA
jgi:uncharacterized RDD family membrane protein YckC